MLNLTNVDDALHKGEEWLETNKKTFLSETETGISFKDNFADLLLLELSNRWIAPEVSANILSLFYSYGRGHEVQESLSYLQKAMALEEYQESRYYFLPEPLFFYTWRLLCIASGSALETIDNQRLPKELHTLRDHLIRRVSARLGTAKDNALCPALRILICHSLGIKNDVDLQLLLDLQEDDGSFGRAWYVRYGSNGIRISHRAFAVVVAIVALRRLKQHMVGMKTAVVNGVNGTTAR
ncbi:MAG: hypothetical protein Q9157_006229 [Trypethelium eluteriae]